MKRIEVAVGVIFNSQQQVLIGQRTVNDAYYQKWEFPGGKLEQGESAEIALARELNEELGISVLESEQLMMLEHDYPDRHVRLYVRIITSYEGAINGEEGQALQWSSLDNLSQLDFLKGNQKIVEKLQSLY